MPVEFASQMDRVNLNTDRDFGNGQSFCKMSVQYIPRPLKPGAWLFAGEAVFVCSGCHRDQLKDQALYGQRRHCVIGYKLAVQFRGQPTDVAPSEVCRTVK